MFLSARFRRIRIRRGVAQPGRAPGSGPGGRRFKSSLPDQSFQSLGCNFWILVYIGVDDFVTVRAFLCFRLTNHQMVLMIAPQDHGSSFRQGVPLQYIKVANIAGPAGNKVEPNSIDSTGEL